MTIYTDCQTKNERTMSTKIRVVSSDCPEIDAALHDIDRWCDPDGRSAITKHVMYDAPNRRLIASNGCVAVAVPCEAGVGSWSCDAMRYRQALDDDNPVVVDDEPVFFPPSAAQHPHLSGGEPITRRAVNVAELKAILQWCEEHGCQSVMISAYPNNDTHEALDATVGVTGYQEDGSCLVRAAIAHAFSSDETNI